MEIFVNSNYNFLKWRFHAVIFSVLFVLAGALLFLKNGVPMGIDFAGGANVMLRFKDPVPIDKLRAIVSEATIQQYGKPEEREVLIRLPKQEKEGDYAGQVVAKINTALNGANTGKIDLNFAGKGAIAELLKAKDPDHKGTGVSANDYYYGVAQSIIDKRSEVGIFTSMAQVSSAKLATAATSGVVGENSFLGAFNLLDQETVGPQVGAELQHKALWAILLSTLAIGVYIGIRFDLKFGVAAVLCLVHDVAVGLAFMAMIHAELEIITVAAFLMIIGYSINDTVVVYDRVRENIKKSRVREDYQTVINHTLNQTLSRTILTSGSVIVVLICLILVGGKVIHNFAWLLLIGTIAGTYSTVTVVPAIVIAWNNWVNRGARPAPARVDSSSRIDSTPALEKNKGKKRAKA